MSTVMKQYNDTHIFTEGEITIYAFWGAATQYGLTRPLVLVDLTSQFGTVQYSIYA